MWLSSYSLFVSVGLASALQLVERDNPSVFLLNFERRVQNVPPFGKRASSTKPVSVETDKHGRQVLYWANFTIGKPPVQLYALVDTGSSDLLVLTNNIAACNDVATCNGGVVDASKSSTWMWTQDAVSGSFGSKEAWEGTMAHDTLVIGGANIPNFTFVGVTDYTPGNSGEINSVFGIGMYGLELSRTKYNNLPYALTDAGYIQTPAFSMYLEDVNNGVFLFGGVNKAKYEEPLVTMPMAIDNTADSVDRNLVIMTGLGTTTSGKSDKMDFNARPVLLDSGAEGSDLTAEMVAYIAEKTNMVLDAVNQVPAAPCDAGDTTVDFSFGELTLKVPLKDLIHPYKKPFGLDGVEYCSMSFTQGVSHIILGDDFLRHAYVVYDYRNEAISLAKLKTDGGRDDIVEIVDDVPGAKAATVTPTAFEDYYDYTVPPFTAVPTQNTVVTLTPVTATGTAATASASGGASGGDKDNGSSAVELSVVAIVLSTVFVMGALL